MNIIVLENEPSSFRGGQERSLLGVCQGLADQGHNIFLLYVVEGNLLEQYRQFCFEIIKVEGYYIDKKRLLSSILGFIKDLRQVQTTENTVIYSNQYHDTPFGSALALLKHKPYICHLRLPPPGNFCGQWKIGLKGVTRFITISQKTQQEWVTCGLEENRIEAVYNGIDTTIFQPSINRTPIRNQWNILEKTIVISYIGRLDREKGLETLIKAFSKVLNKRPNAVLLLAGKPLCHEDEESGQNYIVSLKELSTDLGVASQVKFLGHLDKTQPLYQASDLTVLPSIHSEPFGRAIIESMACGTPAVASRTGGIPEILTGEFEQFLFAPGNDLELAQVIQKTLTLLEHDPDLPKRCRQHVCHNFSLSQMVDGVNEVLLKTLAQYQKQR